MTLDWLESVLGIELSSFGLEPIGADTGFAGSVYRIELARLNGKSEAPESVVWKTASDHKPTRRFLNRLGAYRVESEFYSSIGKSTELTPRCYYSGYAPKTGEVCLILEDLSGWGIGDQLASCSYEEALAVIQELARFHGAHWSGRVDEGLDWAPPFDNGARYIERLHSISWRKMAETRDDLPHGIVDVAAAVGPNVEEIKARLAKSPATLLHGDVRLDNIFFNLPAVRLIDWQAVRVGRGTYDLAYFTSTSLSPEVRRKHQPQLIEAYVESLTASGVSGYSLQMCEEDFRWALLDVVTFLGIIGAALDFGSPRGLELPRTMMSRLSTTIEDNSALDLLTK